MLTRTNGQGNKCTQQQSQTVPGKAACFVSPKLIVSFISAQPAETIGIGMIQKIWLWFGGEGLAIAFPETQGSRRNDP